MRHAQHRRKPADAHGHDALYGIEDASVVPHHPVRVSLAEPEEERTLGRDALEVANAPKRATDAQAAGTQHARELGSIGPGVVAYAFDRLPLADPQEHRDRALAARVLGDRILTNPTHEKRAYAPHPASSEGD